MTGGASGLGKGTVERFVKLGAKAVIVDLEKSPGKEVADQIGKDCIFVPTDVRISLILGHKEFISCFSGPPSSLLRVPHFSFYCQFQKIKTIIHPLTFLPFL